MVKITLVCINVRFIYILYTYNCLKYTEGSNLQLLLTFKKLSHNYFATKHCLCLVFLRVPNCLAAELLTPNALCPGNKPIRFYPISNTFQFIYLLSPKHHEIQAMLNTENLHPVFELDLILQSSFHSLKNERM